MNEACLNASWIREDLTNEKAQTFTRDVLNHMRERLSDYQEMYGDLYNLEATPAESTAYRLAKHDVERWPDIITASSKDCGTPYYTNSSHLPVGYTEDIFTALDVQDELETSYTSGTVFHAFLGEKLPDWKAAANLVRKIAENYRLPYYTLSPTYSVCKNHGYIKGEQFTCPKCGEPCEVNSRITGYYRPVRNWNDGKAQEYRDRQGFTRSDFRTANHGTIGTVHAENKAQESVPEEVVRAGSVDCAILVTTKTCPNCRAAEAMLDEAGIVYKTVLADDVPELVAQFGIRQAPTLLVPDGENTEVITGAGAINAYIAESARV